LYVIFHAIIRLGWTRCSFVGEFPHRTRKRTRPGVLAGRLIPSPPLYGWIRFGQAAPHFAAPPILRVAQHFNPLRPHLPLRAHITRTCHTDVCGCQMVDCARWELVPHSTTPPTPRLLPFWTPTTFCHSCQALPPLHATSSLAFRHSCLISFSVLFTNTFFLHSSSHLHTHHLLHAYHCTYTLTSTFLNRTYLLGGRGFFAGQCTAPRDAPPRRRLLPKRACLHRALHAHPRHAHAPHAPYAPPHYHPRLLPTYLHCLPTLGRCPSPTRHAPQHPHLLARTRHAAGRLTFGYLRCGCSLSRFQHGFSITSPALCLPSLPLHCVVEHC